MIKVSASQEEAEIVGNVDELREVGVTIRNLLAAGTESVSLPAAVHDPTPYDSALTELRVHRKTASLLVTIQGESLCVSGSAERLEELASCFSFPDDARPGHHFHFEAYQGDSDYSADSLALVVSVHHSGA